MGGQTMRSYLLCALTIVLLAAAPARASNAVPKYKNVEAKHFDRAEGVELTPDFSDYLNAELRTELGKSKLFSQVIGEGEVVDDADAASSVVVSGTLTEYKKGSIAKAVIIGYGAGNRSLKMDVNVARHSDQKNLAMFEVTVRADPRWNEKILAREAAKQVVKKIKDSLEHQSA
jgi:uncharacterized protein DUF4410